MTQFASKTYRDYREFDFLIMLVLNFRESDQKKLSEREPIPVKVAQENLSHYG